MGQNFNWRLVTALIQASQSWYLVHHENRSTHYKVICHILPTSAWFCWEWLTKRNVGVNNEFQIAVRKFEKLSPAISSLIYVIYGRVQLISKLWNMKFDLTSTQVGLKQF
jgi:hypothetical protein